MFSAFFISALYCFVFFFKNELSRSTFLLCMKLSWSTASRIVLYSLELIFHAAKLINLLHTSWSVARPSYG